MSNNNGASKMASHKSKTIVLENKTPEFNKSVARDLEDSISKSKVSSSSKTSDVSVDKLISKSYSPTINQLLTNLESLSLHPYSFGCENKQQIRIKKGSKIECIDWKNKEVQNIMLRNLKKKSIDFSKVIAPANIDKNCWFNCFFMCFFISDKGRKFFRYLRHVMITGKFPDHRGQQKHHEFLKWPFFLLNYYIDSSIQGKDDPEAFAEQMNTNTLIAEIGNAISITLPKDAIMPDQYGNPLNFYASIISFLQRSPVGLVKLWPKKLQDAKMVKYLEKQLDGSGQVPHVLVILVNAGKKAKEPFKLTNEYTVQGKKYKYTLDSAIIMSKDKQHYSCLISGNKRDYAFDGAAFSRLTPFEWKNKLNTADEFSFEGNAKKYSFAVSETYLLYYRS